MASPYASEFTPELGSDYLASLLNPIEENERTQVGAARARGAAGGLGMQAATGAEIGTLESDAGTSESNAVAGFNKEVAGAQYGERMTDEKQAFSDSERQQQDAFEKSMTQMGYDNARAVAHQNHEWGIQGAITGAAVNLGSMFLGGAAASTGGKPVDSGGGGEGDEGGGDGGPMYSGVNYGEGSDSANELESSSEEYEAADAAAAL